MSVAARMAIALFNSRPHFLFMFECLIREKRLKDFGCELERKMFQAEGSILLFFCGQEKKENLSVCE